MTLVLTVLTLVLALLLIERRYRLSRLAMGRDWLRGLVFALALLAVPVAADEALDLDLRIQIAAALEDLQLMLLDSQAPGYLPGPYSTGRLKLWLYSAEGEPVVLERRVP